MVEYFIHDELGFDLRRHCRNEDEVMVEYLVHGELGFDLRRHLIPGCSLADEEDERFGEKVCIIVVLA